VRKGFQPQTLLIKNTEYNTVSNTEEVLLRWSEYYEKQFESQDGMENVTVEKSGRCACTLKNQPYVERPNDVDRGIAVSKLENGITTGHDQVPAELVKEGGK
jgi:hypothetical protein